MKCENCGNTHDGSYGSGRFCSIKCARGFSTKAKRQEINKKVSETNKRKGIKPSGYVLTKEDRSKGGRNGTKKRVLLRENEYNEKGFDFCVKKYCNVRLTQYFKDKIIEEQDNKCIKCGLSEWMGDKLVIEIHHVNGIKNNNKRKNLEGLCPNCHSQTDNWKFKNSEIYKAE